VFLKLLKWGPTFADDFWKSLKGRIWFPFGEQNISIVEKVNKLDIIENM